MSLKDTIQSDLTTAVKNKEITRVSTLRMLTAAIQNKEIAKRPDPLSDADVLSVVAAEAKKRADAITDYENGGRAELAEKEKAEKILLETYLPAQLSDEELSKMVKTAIIESGATDAQDFGNVMKVLIPKVKGKAGGKRVSAAVKNALTQKEGAEAQAA